MPELPPIASPTGTVIVPAVAIPEQTFPDLYLVNLRVHTDQDTMQCEAEARLQPYNYSAKQIMKDGPAQTFKIEDVWTEATRVPLLAQVVGGMTQVIALLVQEKTLVGAEAAGQDVAAELAAVRAALGVADEGSVSALEGKFSVRDGKLVIN